MKDETRDLVIIGGGTAGLVAAEVAAAVGASVTLVEGHRLGGDCLWTGCVPSKALLAAARHAQALRHGRPGIAAVEPEVDFGAVMRSVRGAQTVIEPHDSAERLESLGVEVLAGWATIDRVDRRGGRVVIESGDALEQSALLGFRRLLVATGSAPVIPPIVGLDDLIESDAAARRSSESGRVVTTESIWGWTTLPSRLIVLGGGPAGCELAQAFARLGSRVEIVEVAPALVAPFGAEVGAAVRGQLEAEGVRVHLGVGASRVDQGEAGLVVVLADGRHLESDRLLIVTGRRPSTEGFGLEAAGVSVDGRGRVVVDHHLRTAQPAIYAAGDVTGVASTSLAAHQARTLIPHALFGVGPKARPDLVPRVVFTTPEVATVGIEREAAEARWGQDAQVHRFALSGSDRAIAEAAPQGWVEIVASPRGTVVGATVVGGPAGELIGLAASHIEQRRRVDELSSLPLAYPTWLEALSRAGDSAARDRVGTPTVRRLLSATKAVRSSLPA